MMTSCHSKLCSSGKKKKKKSQLWILQLNQACQWDLCHHGRAGWHAGKSICQHGWLCRQNNKFYWKLRRQKFLFFWRLKRDLPFSFCIYHQKSKIMNWTKHFMTTCNIMSQSFKSFQLQTFLFFLILQYPFLS